jgi:hypothetical protein
MRLAARATRRSPQPAVRFKWMTPQHDNQGQGMDAITVGGALGPFVLAATRLAGRVTWRRPKHDDLGERTGRSHYGEAQVVVVEVDGVLVPNLSRHALHGTPIFQLVEEWKLLLSRMDAIRQAVGPHAFPFPIVH